MVRMDESEPLPGPSSSAARSEPKSRHMTALGHFLACAGLVDDAVVAEWERQYTEHLASEDVPLPF